MTTYKQIVKWYRLSTPKVPPPHSGLTREEAVIYRQMQTGSFLTPMLMRHVYPSVYESDVCRVCQKERVTAAHILWDCAKNPREASRETMIPPHLEPAWGSYYQEQQNKSLRQISANLERQRPSETGEKLPPNKGAGEAG